MIDGVTIDNGKIEESVATITNNAGQRHENDDADDELDIQKSDGVNKTLHQMEISLHIKLSNCLPNK